MENILPQEMKRRYELAKELIENSQDIKIYSHTDCDGISSGAILSTILDRLNKPHEIEIVNLDVLEDLAIEHELTIFSDLGSGQNIVKNAKDNSKILVLDHHPPLRDIDYNKDVDFTYIEINPNHYGINGSSDICGGGLCYLLAKEFGFTDLSWIGVLAAIGDMQNTKTGKLEGLNKHILEDAEEEGLVSYISDISLYGRQTRPLFVALSYFSDVKLPITNNKNETIAVLQKLDIPRKIGDKTTTLSDLTPKQKQKLFSELLSMLSKEVPGEYVKYIPKLIVADSYEFLMEDDNTFLRDASEFSTAMNACVRNDRADVALEILKGNRLESLDELELISKDHRRYLAENIQKMEMENPIVQMDNIQYFDGTGIRSNVVGTIAGMILSYGDWKKPIIAFTQVNDENDDYKISLRCSRLLAYSGIHFGFIIRKVAQELGGNGGGHDVACGAYIPHDKKDEFLKRMDEEVAGLIKI
ncbi:MAG: DHH family phosphoesterase [archaeon]|nr:DHH family phosphoesterase [archaeon]